MLQNVLHLMHKVITAKLDTTLETLPTTDPSLHGGPPDTGLTFVVCTQAKMPRLFSKMIMITLLFGSFGITK